MSGAWGGQTKADLERRDDHVHELWAMGFTRDEIALVVDLTPSRISQIVRSFDEDIDRDCPVCRPRNGQTVLLGGLPDPAHVRLHEVVRTRRESRR